jgi:pimeloyl-ACP methyl ester carboxylesterase
MKYFTIASFVALAILTACSKNKGNEQQGRQFQITTSDSLNIFGDLYIANPEGLTIILFHQGGSNARGEYEPIINRLQKEGYNILAIDQRRGGQTYGSFNRTVAKLKANSYSYCDSYPDLEATLVFANESKVIKGKKVIWGSSYSASLAVQLANKNIESVSGVLAFSPASGGPMAECKPDPYIEDLEMPVLLLRPESEMEIESVQAQFRLFDQLGHQTYVAETGTHGSSMLVEERAGGNVEKNWETVLEFLSAIADKN